ncbi:hypothetical protein M378DRAFT_182428 [Amanita muscaria Koide BX008]|uniref:Uncharacterized protein n=1 Tax=Amanita muscaria (strain Koide BX008) TaxID=946122 RepID=A0A0C2SLG1_AMAMK|nr:hypothetical protein M378DRAFT_182428 [Amanita muscaria Koide BX008]
MERAREEIRRLNIEIRRVITHMHDKLMVLQKQEDVHKDKDPYLAHQVHLYKMERAQANSLHTDHFQKLSVHPGFTGDLSPRPTDGVTQPNSPVMQASPMWDPMVSTSDSDSKSGEEEIKDIAYKIFKLSLSADGVDNGLDDGMPPIKFITCILVALTLV